jgi:phosphopentomutase
MRPPPTVLNALAEAGWPVKSIGKTFDLFAGEGITESHPSESNSDGMRQIEQVWAETKDGLVFVNLVDFDTIYGHRRDPAGYSAALRQFDTWLATFLPRVRDEDLLIITADHGNDPTFRGTDHTREQVPLLVKFDGHVQSLGARSTFADVAATLSDVFLLPRSLPAGKSLING